MLKDHQGSGHGDFAYMLHSFADKNDAAKVCVSVCLDLIEDSCTVFMFALQHNSHCDCMHACLHAYIHIRERYMCTSK